MASTLIRRLGRPASSGVLSRLPALYRGVFSWSCGRRFHHSDPELWTREDHPKIKLSFVLRNGEKKIFYSPKDVSLLEAAQHEELDIEGACEASLACSTCHVILDKPMKPGSTERPTDKIRDWGEIYDGLEPPSEREEDMLDMAPQVCETSRLACQIRVDEKLTKGNIRLPNATRNFYVDGFKPSPH
ncbi:putative ferredoxin-like protein Fd1 [Cryptosporidium canis]|uniref:Ferredoxin-like protein Fd1 n=1 Tax=Cryptosporidium canis TaxID=195482 RepID=A0A9D5HYS9_9CRYT|nr:putative ferredoxin-like protein Fd1 [Cryptosporidium canis]